MTSAPSLVSAQMFDRATRLKRISPTMPTFSPSIRPSRSRRSACEVARHRMAITSEATTMSKPSSRGWPLAGPPRPTVSARSARSFMSMTRRQLMRRTSMSSALPWWTWLSMAAASRLLASAIAWKSPVKWRLMSSMGTTCARPPPVAPPFRPNTGPSEGSRSAIRARSPIRLSASPRPTVVVVLPSPAGVGLIAVTRISRPSGRSRNDSMKGRVSLALW